MKLNSYKMRLFIPIFSIISLFVDISYGREKSPKNDKVYDVDAYIWPSTRNEEGAQEVIWPEGIRDRGIIKKGTSSFEGYYHHKIPLLGYEMNDYSKVLKEWIDGSAGHHSDNAFIFDRYWFYGEPFLWNSINDGFLTCDNQYGSKNTQINDWKYLFNGKDTSGWHNYLSGKPIEWEVNNGILCTPGGKGDIVTDKDYENFILEVDWKIEKGGNSGIFYHILEDGKYKSMYETGPEFQIIDEENYPGELLEKQKTGSSSDVLAPDFLNSNRVGKWNHTKIKVLNGNVEHWLNGKKILEFSMDSKRWKDKVKDSKFANSDYAKVRKGKIGLQDHGTKVCFKLVRIKEL